MNPEISREQLFLSEISAWKVGPDERVNSAEEWFLRRANLDLWHLQGNPDEESSFRLRHSVDEAVSTKEFLERRAREEWGRYERAFPAESERMLGIARQSALVAFRRGWLGEPRPVRIVVCPTNERVHESSGRLTLVGMNAEDSLVAHETGHALSDDPNGPRSGFFEKTEGPNARGIGSNTLNEGTTIRFEYAVLAQPAEAIDAIYHESLYGFFRDLTAFVRESSGISDDDWMKAYFGDLSRMRKLEDAVRARFGLELESIDLLSSVTTDIGLARRALNREPVSVRIHRRPDEKADWVRSEIARVFPSITIP